MTVFSAWKRLWILVAAPVLPQVLGSVFNIWYNGTVIEPLLSEPLRHQFYTTVTWYNALVYPTLAGVWVWLVLSFRHGLRSEGGSEEVLLRLRRRLVNLPWLGSVLPFLGWSLCVPVFLGSLAMVPGTLPGTLLWHLPVSFLVSGFISLTHSFFLVELASYRTLYPVLFNNERPDQVSGTFSLSLEGRGIAWALSAGICPIGSLILLAFAPQDASQDSQWFVFFVGSVGIAFGLCTAVMMSRLVARPVQILRSAAQEVARGNLDFEVKLLRADEFGLLVYEFNRMVRELKEKQKLRQMFGLHVGTEAAERLLKNNPELSGTEEVITVMFVDIRNFTARSASRPPDAIVKLLNTFFDSMIDVIEVQHGGMINKFLGDGFMALFGTGGESKEHAQAAFGAGCSMLKRLPEVNRKLAEMNESQVEIGIGLATGPAVVGSIGSSKRMEFTAIGNTVNLASRIEGLTKKLERPLLMSKAVYEQLNIKSGIELVGREQVKGVDEPVELYAIKEQP